MNIVPIDAVRSLLVLVVMELPACFGGVVVVSECDASGVPPGHFRPETEAGKAPTANMGHLPKPFLTIVKAKLGVTRLNLSSLNRVRGVW
jgi:hypothetical protein